jgi:hypothetical protein
MTKTKVYKNVWDALEPDPVVRENRSSARPSELLVTFAYNYPL